MLIAREHDLEVPEYSNCQKSIGEESGLSPPLRKSGFDFCLVTSQLAHFLNFITDIPLSYFYRLYTVPYLVLLRLERLPKSVRMMQVYS